MRFSLLTSCALLAMTMISTTSQAAIYKWTDAGGKVHYSSKKPQNMDAQQLDIRGRTVTKSKVTNKTKTSEKTKADKKSDEVDKKNKKVDEENKKIKARNCSNKQQAIQRLQSGGRITEMKDGEAQFLSDADMKNKLESQQAAYNEECSE